MPTFRRKNLSVTVEDFTQYATVYQTEDGNEIIVGTLIRRRVFSSKGKPTWSVANTNGEVLVESNFVTHCLQVLGRSLQND